MLIFATHQKQNPCKVLIYRNFLCFTFFPAERRGFEPRIPFWGIHAFQACLFNHSSTSPFRGAKVKEVFETTKYLVVSKTSFTFAPRKGEVLEWLKRHAWKACIPQKGIRGSNPRLSAGKNVKQRKFL